MMMNRPKKCLEQVLQILDTLVAGVGWLQERAAMAGWPVPDTPEEIAAWALDEMEIQLEQAHDHPDEAASRLPFAGEMAFLASTFLWNGVMPAQLPWKTEPFHEELSDDQKKEVAQCKSRVHKRI